MSLWKLLFGKSGPAQDALTGAAIGGIIGATLDAAKDRHEIIKLLKYSNAKSDYEQTQADIRRRIKALDKADKAEAAKIEAWQWRWRMPDDEDHVKIHEYFKKRISEDKEFKDKYESIRERWHDLRERALRVGIMPLTYMPRSTFGDVVGTEAMLNAAMDMLEETVIEWNELKKAEKSDAPNAAQEIIISEALEFFVKLGENRTQAKAWINEIMHSDCKPNDTQSLVQRVYQTKAKIQ